MNEYQSIVSTNGHQPDIELQQENRRLRERIAALEQELSLSSEMLPDTESLRFEDLFDLQEIQQIQDAFSLATGVASVITNTDGEPITQPSNFCSLCQLIRSTERGLINCMHSDAELGRVNTDGPHVQPCLSGGLYDGGTSIMAGERHIANWLIGQVLDETFEEERMIDYAHEIGADENEFRQALKHVRRMPKEQFMHISNALFLIARQMSQLAEKNVRHLHFIAEQKRQEEERTTLQQRVIEAQRETLRELSTPLIPISERVVIMPLIGTIDSQRAQIVMETLLQGVAQHQAALVILDITGVQVVDTQVAQTFIQAAQAVRLLGAQVMLTGIQPQIAQTLVQLGVDLSGIITRGSLQAGIADALHSSTNHG
jgi:anti-anti-sigma factor